MLHRMPECEEVKKCMVTVRWRGEGGVSGEGGVCAYTVLYTNIKHHAFKYTRKLLGCTMGYNIDGKI